jgi:anti-anti-sigma regulatory factor
MAQALLTSEGFDAEIIRGVEALRHMPAMVSLLDRDGMVVMHNPASMSAFEKAPLRSWFVDETVAPALLAAVDEDRVFQAEVEVRASAQERWHTVEARRTVDPVTGAPATLVLQLDVTPLRETQKRLAQKEQEIRALAAPILDVGEGVLAVPLFSALDGPRSAVITDRLLREVVARRAQSIILDLTGIDSFDAVSIEALLGLARTTALLGARPIVTGVGPALAEALVRSGNDLCGLRTMRTLRDALREP